MGAARDYDADFEEAALAVQQRQMTGATLRVIDADDDLPLDVEPAPLWPCRPFAWKDPATLPTRESVYGRHYVRKFVSATFSPGGLGKSSLACVEALVMASGKPLLGVKPVGRTVVAYWGGEDPEDETERRVMAAAVHHGLTAADLSAHGVESEDPSGAMLYLGSGRQVPIVLAEQQASGVTINGPNVEAIEAMISAYGIGVVIIDPFVSSHRVSENDNNAIDRVVKAWAQIADRRNVSVELVHHTRKGNGAETTVEDGRGATALLYAARSARVLNGMTQEEADRAGVENRYEYFRLDHGKANMAPRSGVSAWHRLVNFDLDNGWNVGPSDHIGVVTAWDWPDAFSGVTAADLLAVQKAIDAGHWRENIQAAEWAGKAVAEAMGLDLDDKGGRQKAKNLLRNWLKEGALTRIIGRDGKGNERPMIEVGKWVEP
ncbi:AAA family ATPase [Brevundimonas sp. DC300-4]|uniref:AAA family ATPase n=1 Tax=Brevundimonas sp. DC300-4 TaxID=2804594 RepID=UPI003CF9CA95